jgi:hypothetical protein
MNRGGFQAFDRVDTGVRGDGVKPVAGAAYA